MAFYIFHSLNILIVITRFVIGNFCLMAQSYFIKKTILKNAMNKGKVAMNKGICKQMK